MRTKTNRWFTLPCLALGLWACTAPVQETPPRADAGGVDSSRDPYFDCDHFVHLQRYTLLSKLDPGPIATFARLTPKQRAALEVLFKRSGLRQEILVTDGRLLLSLPATHPSGEMEILLAEDLNKLVIFQPKKKHRTSLPRDRLPDVLEGVAPSSRANFSMTALEPAAAQTGPLSRSKTRSLATRIGLRYRANRKSLKARSLRITFQVTVREEPRRLPITAPLLHVALPLLQSRQGVLLLESLAYALGRPPHGWERQVIDERGHDGAAMTLRTEVHDRGLTRVARCRMSAFRKGYKDVRLGSRSKPGMQLLPPRSLGALRKAPAGGPLRVSNHSTSPAYVYIDGALLGWVGPGKRMSFKGLSPGFYRVYGRSPTGLHCWGPHDTYVPGPLAFR